MSSFGDFPVNGKIAVVTGGGSGINYKFAQLAHALDAKVIIADFKLTEAARSLVENNQNVVFVECDVTNWSDLSNLVVKSEEHFGDVPDVYIPGAGVFEVAGKTFWDDREKDRFSELDINTSHPIKLTRLAIRASLARNKKAVICITASIAGLNGSYACPLYCASKFAIVGFVRSMAQADPLEGIKVCCICPTFVNTPLIQSRPDKVQQFSYTANDYLEPEQVAQAMLDLVQKCDYAGGTVMDITRAGVRVLPEWNISPPTHTLVDQMKGNFEVMDAMLAPVKEITNRERSKAVVER